MVAGRDEPDRSLRGPNADADREHPQLLYHRAHPSHDKSTLADQFLRTKTGTISERDIKAQTLEQHGPSNRSRITITHATRSHAIYYEHNGTKYELNLIDTPGHVDFNYEVSRSLAACEGAILLADAFQGVQAQAVANGVPHRDGRRAEDHPHAQRRLTCRTRARTSSSARWKPR